MEGPRGHRRERAERAAALAGRVASSDESRTPFGLLYELALLIGKGPGASGLRAQVDAFAAEMDILVGNSARALGQENPRTAARGAMVLEEIVDLVVQGDLEVIAYRIAEGGPRAAPLSVLDALRQRLLKMFWTGLRRATPQVFAWRRWLLRTAATLPLVPSTYRRIAAETVREQVFETLVDAVPELALSVRVNIDERNREDIEGLIDLLAEEGLGGRPNLKMYFAPVEAMTEGWHGVTDVTMSKSRYARLEAELYRHGFKAGLTALPYPPRFHGTCAAVRPRGFVIVPSGDIHKCWDTVSDPSRAIGTLFDLDAVHHSELSKAWLRWTPFANETCRNCKILPNCAGTCAYKFVHGGSQRGEAAILPCPSWKYNIRERLLLRAVETGALCREDYDMEEARRPTRTSCAPRFISRAACRCPRICRRSIARSPARRAAACRCSRRSPSCRP